MRAVVQRVSEARVVVDQQTVGQIGAGLCVLVGIGKNDTSADARALADKVLGLRIFEDAAQKMNLSVQDTGGALLAISQFTLLGDTRKGKRPSFGAAMEPTRAQELFELFCESCRQCGTRVETGRFRAHMDVTLTNSGPVTILLDTEKTF